MKTMLMTMAALVTAVPAAAQDRKGEDVAARQQIEAKLKNLRVTLDFKGAIKSGSRPA